ncbi:MAG: hypothetical protein ACK4YP_24230, partial [Myxococcota bacterium]
MFPALALAAVVSTAGGIVTHGIYFLAHAAYGFDDRQNLWLAIALFVPYVPAALVAGPLGRRFGARATLHAANALMIAAGLVLATKPPAWGLWVAAPLYNGAAGLFWPLVEGYVAGGRHGPGLHRAIGAFNLTWSLTLAPALWIVGLAGDDLALSFGALLFLHVLGAFAIAALPASPAPADHASAAPVGPDYPGLLRSSRVLLPVSYVLLDALSPLLPGVWARAGVDGALGPALSSTWMVARFAVFAALAKWSGWRGQPVALLAGAVALLGGFVAALGGGDIALVLVGLVAFGFGQGTLYYQALYYGMAVGKGEVDSGGTHEAVIGLGYLGGP